MQSKTIVMSARLTPKATFLLCCIKKNMTEKVVNIPLAELEKLGIYYQDIHSLMLELGAKPMNYLSKDSSNIVQWCYEWQLKTDALLVKPSKCIETFTVDEILLLASHSIYTPAVYSLLQKGLSCSSLTNIDISVVSLRTCCDCLNKYVAFSQLKNKVLDTALSELTNIFQRTIDYSYLKNGKEIQAIRFAIAQKQEGE